MIPSTQQIKVLLSSMFVVRNGINCELGLIMFIFSHIYYHIYLYFVRITKVMLKKLWNKKRNKKKKK